ncbi:MAG: ABC transporter ATP-binding protein [Phycisphaeraceae bacterium]
MASDEPTILLQDVRFGYERDKPVIDGVSAQLRPGRVTALVGPNASGKSTLVRLMLGLARPWSGVVEVGGLRVDRMSPTDRARWMSYVPQRPGVRFAFTVRQVVAMGGHASAARSPGRIGAALEEAGLAPLADRVFAELSGGQQQRVLLTRATLQADDAGRAMLLDEPGSHLDLHHRHATMRQLRGLAHGRGLAVLVVVHDLDLAGRYADDAWLLDRGTLVAAGPWDAVLTPALLGPVYRLPLQRLDVGEDRPLIAVAPPTAATIPSESTDPPTLA